MILNYSQPAPNLLKAETIWDAPIVFYTVSDTGCFNFLNMCSCYNFKYFTYLSLFKIPPITTLVHVLNVLLLDFVPFHLFFTSVQWFRSQSDPSDSTQVSSVYLSCPLTCCETTIAYTENLCLSRQTWLSDFTFFPSFFQVHRAILGWHAPVTWHWCSRVMDPGPFCFVALPCLQVGLRISCLNIT